MQKNDIGWKRMRFKGNKVWAAVDAKGSLRIEAGRVLIKYRHDQDYEYRVHPQNLAPVDGSSAAPPEKSASPRIKTAKKQLKSSPSPTSESDRADIPENAIRIYTDGASSGNPGPAGIGVLLSFGDRHKELSEYIGVATNNVAELKAILAGLAAVKDRALPVRLFTDSGYALGLLVLNWKPKKNQALVAEIKALMSTFKDLKMIKVKGHAGDAGNERADFLATSAAKKGST